jgi:hypothetical protein
VTATALKSKIALLQADIARLERRLADRQAVFRAAAIERQQAEQLMTELLQMTADLMSAREAESLVWRELRALRSLRSSKPWWWRMPTDWYCEPPGMRVRP